MSMAQQLDALSPIDGRYLKYTESLKPYWSEFALIKYRLIIEVKWLMTLAESPAVKTGPAVDRAAKNALNQLIEQFDLNEAIAIKKIEATTKHDVKAVEYYLKSKCQTLKPWAPYLEMIHFGCTSEDINNLAYALMLKDSIEAVIVPQIQEIREILNNKAAAYKDKPMLARTHGQSASPTTMGKEFAVFAHRLTQPLERLKSIQLTGKFSGAVGNFNAHKAADPTVNWPQLAQQFVQNLGLTWHGCTTQIEPHDQLAHLCHTLIQCHQIMLDCCKDLWHYISLDYFQQSKTKGQVGSSAMPHKINPIYFENAEGNLGLANALLGHFAEKLTISRLQRDLSDSTVLRQQGVALAHGLIAYQNIIKGLSTIALNATHIEHELNQHWEVIAEGIQTILRYHHIPNAYEKLQTLTQGQTITQDILNQWLKKQNFDPKITQKIQALSPMNYLGYADQFEKMI